MFNLWRDPAGVIHADNPVEGDRSLCGMAEEGPSTGEDGDGHLVEVKRGRISCRACIAIIDHCKGIPARKVKR